MRGKVKLQDGASTVCLAQSKATFYNTNMKIDIHRVAKLADIPLSETEAAKLEKQLEETLDYVAQLNTLDTEHVEPTSQVTGLENVTRDDVVTPSLSQEEALKNAKRVHNGFFVVDAVLAVE